MKYLELLETIFISGLKFIYNDFNKSSKPLKTESTIIKDDVPTGETWSVVPVGASNRFSYSTTRAGTTSTIKWVSYTQVVSIAWS